jgi:glycosyltransferase involved in cell wall biosynthesis
MIVQNSYPSDVRVRKEVRVLLSRGHQVSVIALGNPGEEKHELIDGAKIYRLFLQKKRSGAFRYMAEYFLFFLYSMFKVNLLDLREKFDVIHINTLPDFLVFSALIQKVKGRRLILDMHEIMPEFFMSKFKVNIKHPVVRLLLFLERMSLRFADDVITINEPIKRIFQKRAVPDKTVAVVMNTMDEGTIEGNGKRDHVGFNCVYHGTITDIYGLDIAIEGFCKARQNIGDMVFHIFGEGPHLSQIKGIAERLGIMEYVIFHGAVPYEKMIEWLSEMDLGLLATRKDVFLNLSFSNKLAEYIHLKIPVIASDLETTKYYFGSGDILFFEAGNVNDLAEKIRFAYSNRNFAQAMAERAYETERGLGWNVMAQRYLDVVEGHGSNKKGYTRKRKSGSEGNS